MTNCNIDRPFITAVLLSILMAISSLSLEAQTAAFKGSVTTTTLSVRYAAVTFIDKSDTTKRITVFTDTSGKYIANILTSVSRTEPMPVKSELEQNYPNPFTSSTSISYRLNAPSSVTVTVYDILGREIRSFSPGDQSTGLHSVLWDGKNDLGEVIARGIYFCRLQAQGETQIRKMIFGIGPKNITGSALIVHPSEAPNFLKEMNSNALAGTFIVRVANTDSTFPAIVPQQFDNVAAQATASTDFNVSTNGTFPDVTWGVIYPDDPQQVIRGFGGANILQWRPDMTTSQVQKAFGSGPGQIGLSILRLRVPYDSSGTAFSMQIPTAKLVRSLGGIVFASPWTPPPAMKSNNNIVAGILNESSYADFAAYLRSFANYMSANGAPLYAISLQNEPDANVTYESCSWSPTQFLNFMKNNAPAIGIKVMMPESENFQHSLSDPTLNDSVACANTAIIAGHLYGGGLGSYPLATGKGKEFWMSEYLDTDTTWAGTQGNTVTGVLSTGKQISDCMKAGMNAYVWWYTVRYYGPVDESGNVSKRGYVMSQFARFVRPGFTRSRSTDYGLRSLVDVTGYRNGAKLVLVVVNRNSTATTQTFVIWNGTTGSFTPYVTSSSKNCEQQSAIGYKNGTFKYSLEPLSITTFVLN